MDDGPSSLKKWKDKFFLIDRRAILDYLTWRHSCLCVSDDLLIDGYDRNDVERLCARLIYLRKMREEVLVRSGLSCVWFNKECDMVFQRIDDNAGRLGDCNFYSLFIVPFAIILLPLFIVYQFIVPSHTTAPAAEGTIIPLPTPNEIAASLSDSRLAKKSKGPSQTRVRLTLDTTPEPSRPSKKRKLKKKALEAGSNVSELDQAKGVDGADLADLCAKIEDSLERDKGVSTRAVSVPISRLGKRLGAPPSIAVVSASKPSYVGSSAPASTSGRTAAQKVSNFHVAAKADFNKALVNVPTTPFPFLSKIAVASRGTLSEVTQVLPDKHIRSVIPASAIPPIANEDAGQVPLEHASYVLAASI
ncbi:hypothetical protein Tco_0185441 [Tanacetum coccineum]